MLQRKSQALEEVAYYKNKLRRPGKCKAFYEAEIVHEQKFVDLVDAFIPSEKTRRQTGFDIRKWRKANPMFHQVMAKGRSRRSPRRKAG